MRWDDDTSNWERRRYIFPRSVKNKLFMGQKGKCAYCGRLHRIRYFEIDHKYPFSRGGGNEIGNLQLLCTPCNMRKGIQSDEEFRDRYWRLLPRDGSIPDPPVSQEAFSEETEYTRASYEVRRIYFERFANARRKRFAHARGGGGSGCGFALAVWAVVIIVVCIVIAFSI